MMYLTVWSAIIVLLIAVRLVPSWTVSSWGANVSFIEAGTAPSCPAELFDAERVAAYCFQDWNRNGRWFMRVRSSGIPSHAYGRQGDDSWTHLVLDQGWDINIPLATSEQSGPHSRIDPTDFLTAAASQDVPLGIALNGVPFMSPLTLAGADTVSAQPGVLAVNETLFDECAGSLQAHSGAYGYRVMPPCLYPSDSVSSQTTRFEPALAIAGFQSNGPHMESSLQPASPLLGFAMDGRHVYGPYDAAGALAWGLDACNGRWEANGRHNETLASEGQEQYTYRATPSFPYLVGCPGPAGTHDYVDPPAEDPSGAFEFSASIDGYFVRVPGEACPAGSFMMADSGECLPCRAGTFGKNAGLMGGDCPELCPLGYYCPEGTATPSLRCPPGTFGAALGLKDALCSGECQEGYFCLSGSKAPDSHECGAASHFCPEGSGRREIVSSGHYSTPESPAGATDEEVATRRRRRSGQARCEAGSYCVDGIRRPCPAGTYGAQGGLTSPNCTAPCPMGHFCLAETVSPTKCPAGSFGGEEGLKTSKCSGLCERGHYCPQGSTSAYQESCPAGRFGPARGLEDELCDEDRACARSGDSLCIRSLCEAGFHCPPGSLSARAKRCGSGDVFCPRGSAYPSLVDEGHYSYSADHPDGGLGDFWSSSGQETRSAQAACEPGHYCVNGQRKPCPAGTIGSTSGLASEACSGRCPAGYFCGPGLAEALEGQRCGSPAWYCPEGSGARLEVGAGNYSIGGPPDRRSAQAVCLAGTFCRGGDSHPCPAGTYGAIAGLSSPTCSGLCPAGRYCPRGTASANGTSLIGIACPAGRYGVPGMGDAACAGQCEAGYYCPEASISARQERCGSELRFCPTGAAEPLDVGVGWYSTGGGSLTRTGQAECRVGITPPSGTSIVERCPDNTVYANQSGFLQE